MIFVQSTNERVYVITTSERVEYPLTPPEGSWRKMKIISFFPNGKITNLKKDYNHENSYKQQRDKESKRKLNKQS